MAYDDKKDTFFPTRHPTGTGRANERHMLDNASGATGIKTRVREVADGTVTLRTRAGFPHFSLERKTSSDVSYDYKYTYGLVDTQYSPTGTNDSSNASVDLRYLVDENGSVRSGPSVLLKDGADWKAELHADLPTNYSGMLRRVVQVQHGTREKKLSDSPVVLPKRKTVDQFSFTYATSNGLWVDDATGKRFIIEIDSTGVYRVPVAFSKELAPVTWRADEAAIYAGNTFEVANNLISPYWDVIEFDRTTRIKIGDPPTCYASGYGTWYSWLGWGFNYTGTAATLVCIRDDPSDGSWLQTTIFDITITGIDGVPSYVEASSSDPNRIATNINDPGISGTGAFQVADTFAGVCSTVSLYRPDAPALTAAIYSYYGPSGAKRVFHYRNYAESAAPGYVNNQYDYTTAITTTGWWSGPYSSSDGCRHPIDGVVSSTTTGTLGGGFGFIGTTMPTGADDKNTSKVETVRKACGVSGWARFSGQPPYSWKIVYGGDEDGAVYQDTLGYTGYWWLQADARVDVTTSAHVDSIVTNSAVVMLGYDREAFAFAVYKNNYDAEHTESDSVAICTQFNGSVVATGEPGRPNFDLAIGAITNYFPPPDPPGGAVYTIAGFIDHSPTAGLGIQGSGSGLYVAPVYPGSLVSISTGSRTIPESITTSGGWYICIGDNEYTLPLQSDAVFDVYSGGTFGYRLSGSAFSGSGTSFARRTFYSEDIILKPLTGGIGGYKCVYTLQNFIGAF